MERVTAAGGHGTAVWSSSGWRAGAVAWVDEQLAAAGLARTGEVEQPRVRPWATVLRVPVAGAPAGAPAGAVWLKACAPGTAYEVGLYEVLVDAVPDRVLRPLATDVGRGWLLLPDGGTPQGERLTGHQVVPPFVSAVAAYGQLQRDVAPRVDELLGAGVPDLRPAAMPARLEEALAATEALARSRPDWRDGWQRVVGLRPRFAAWCAQLADSALPASLDHNDLHPWNVLEDLPPGARVPTGYRFYDWGDAVVAHPFAALYVPLRIAAHLLDAPPDDPAVLSVRDAYLDGFRDLAPGEDLVATAATACRVATVARTLTWERGLRAAREQGDAIDADRVAAPLEHLLEVLEP